MLSRQHALEFERGDALLGLGKQLGGFGDFFFIIQLGGHLMQSFAVVDLAFDVAPQIEVFGVVVFEFQNVLGALGIFPKIRAPALFVPLFYFDVLVREVKDTSIALRALRGTILLVP